MFKGRQLLVVTLVGAFVLLFKWAGVIFGFTDGLNDSAVLQITLQYLDSGLFGGKVDGGADHAR